MQLTLVQDELETVAQVGARRRICRISSQLLEIQWEWCVLQLRTIDLFVLHDGLTNCLDLLCVEQNEDYLLDINGLQIHLYRTDLVTFDALIRAAIEQLPTQVVRWKEVQVSLMPYAPRLVRRTPLVSSLLACLN